MTDQEHKRRGHHRDHQADRGDSQAPAWWKRLHRDWRVWAAVALMLLAMVVYVLTMDEAVEPGKGVQQPVPAAP